MTGSAKQSMSQRAGRMDCFVASLLAMTARGLADVAPLAHASGFAARREKSEAAT
jgi:hypothetical protein